MDFEKSGKFIAELRKEKGLTQEQLGEKIGVTNKTVSRWETGTYLPPADALLAMSELFGVSINEILSGKRLSNEEYKEAAEENLTQTIKASSFTLKERIQFFKKKWLKEHIFRMVCFVVFWFCIVILMGVRKVNPGIAGLLGGLLAYCFYVILYNQMMSYVEKNAYDGSNDDVDAPEI